ncbi:LysR family transcriptional regulator [Aquabacterium sp. NJ1]|uniref:LysR family transcriptional regulator n=1 Tax=Aquabacterium sp. NJ1 TaxID=1538295 RepID=UPI000690C2AB|nr:LysR family transcriptional regulator [Aquabacterium sp. NJ1]
MNIEPNDLLLFARVVDAHSFSRAAEQLGLPKSTVSRRVAGLEAQLGERLLLRTTRKLTLTDFGHTVLEHAQQIVAEVDAASSLAQHRQAQPSGRLRVTMPSDFASMMLAPMMADFVRQYPAISLELDLTPRRVDLIGENMDLAIRMGDLPDDASLAARRLAVFTTGLYASPAYLAARGHPSEPEALMEHDTLRLLGRDGDAIPWVLQRDEAHWTGIPPGRATANSPDLLMRMALAGAGVALINDYFAEAHVRSGDLQPVLPDWRAPSTSAWAVFPGRRLMPARTRVFLDALQAKLSGEHCQEAANRIAQTLHTARQTARRAAHRN